MADAETITAEQYADLKAQLDKVNSDLEFQKSEARKAFEKRDELKKQIEETERKKAEENNEFKTLYEKEQTEKAKLLTELEEVKPFKEKFTALESDIRKGYLDSIKDEDLRKIAETLNTEQLKIYSAKHSDKGVATDENRPGKGKLNFEGKKWDDLTSKELDQLAKENPDRYNQLRKEKYK